MVIYIQTNDNSIANKHKEKERIERKKEKKGKI